MGVPLKEILEATSGTLVSGPDGVSFVNLYVDSREVEPDGLFVALKGEQQDGHAFIPQALERGASGVLCTVPPGGVPNAAVIQVPDTKQALFDVTTYRLHHLRLPIVAITGSAGKTTTKDLVAHVLGRRLRVRKSEGNLNTYTGIPMTVFQTSPEDRVLVVEYAMSRSGEIRELAAMAPPNIGVVLNVGLAHVGRLGSIDAVTAAKRELVEGLAADGLAVLNADDPRARSMAAVARRSVLYGFAGDATVRAEKIRLHGLDGSSFRLKTRRGDGDVFLKLPGQHSISNALAAAAVALEFDFDAPAIASALHGFNPPSRRMNVVQGKNGSTIIDDSYNASPGSMHAALAVLRMAPRGSRRIAVLGDMLELGDHAGRAHADIGALVPESADDLFAVGEHAGELVAAALAGGMAPAHAMVVDSLDEAIARLVPILARRTHVLVKGSRGMRMERIVSALTEGA